EWQVLFSPIPTLAFYSVGSNGSTRRRKFGSPPNYCSILLLFRYNFENVASFFRTHLLSGKHWTTADEHLSGAPDYSFHQPFSLLLLRVPMLPPNFLGSTKPAKYLFWKLLTDGTNRHF